MSDPRTDRSGPDALVQAVAVLALTLLVLAAFMVYQALAARNVLLITLGAQEQPLRQAAQVKTQLDTLASATAKLAEQGDKGAKEIIDGLKSQGITIRD